MPPNQSGLDQSGWEAEGKNKSAEIAVLVMRGPENRDKASLHTGKGKQKESTWKDGTARDGGIKETRMGKKMRERGEMRERTRSNREGDYKNIRACARRGAGWMVELRNKNEKWGSRCLIHWLILLPWHWAAQSQHDWKRWKKSQIDVGTLK